ncbi:hypothetical protein [Pseudaminobacter soli (ex Zhang et al. 2022)]|nr:hypothetical protein [Pseudaminobacter soli]
MAKYEVKLVPNNEPNADGVWKTVDLPFQPKCGLVIGDHHVVKYHVYQPATMSGDRGWWM